MTTVASGGVLDWCLPDVTDSRPTRSGVFLERPQSFDHLAQNPFVGELGGRHRTADRDAAQFEEVAEEDPDHSHGKVRSPRRVRRRTGSPCGTVRRGPGVPARAPMSSSAPGAPGSRVTRAIRSKRTPVGPGWCARPSWRTGAPGAGLVVVPLAARLAAGAGPVLGHLCGSLSRLIRRAVAREARGGV